MCNKEIRLKACGEGTDIVIGGAANDALDGENGDDLIGRGVFIAYSKSSRFSKLIFRRVA
jgi:hypothetical protein